jgi:hypothetical protein
MSGVVALVIELIRRYCKYEVSNNWYVWIFIICLMLGMFSAWREKKTELLTSQKELIAEREKITKLEVQVKIGEEAQAEKQQSQRALQALQRQLAPRRIGKRNEFISALREAGQTTLNLTYIAGNGEVVGLYADLHDLLLIGGWVIKDKSSVNGTPWRGVRVAVKDRNVPPAGAVLMVELLNQNGIAAGLVEISASALDMSSDMFSIDIGYKP